MSEPAEIRDLENRFFNAFEQGDSAAIAACYAEDMRVWNNVQQREATGSEHIAGLQAQFFPHYANRRFVEARTDLIEGGFVRQHVFTASLAGNPVRIPMCIVCRVSNGKMTRIDEYLTFAAPPTP